MLHRAHNSALVGMLPLYDLNLGNDAHQTPQTRRYYEAMYGGYATSAQRFSDFFWAIEHIVKARRTSLTKKKQSTKEDFI